MLPVPGFDVLVNKNFLDIVSVSSQAKKSLEFVYHGPLAFTKNNEQESCCCSLFESFERRRQNFKLVRTISPWFLYMNTVEFNYQQLFLKDWRTISFLISFLARSGFCSNLFSTLNPQNDEMWKFGQSEADALRFLIDSFLTNTQIWWTGLRSSEFGPCFGSRNYFNAKDTINLHQIILQFVSGNVLSKLTGSTR